MARGKHQKAKSNRDAKALQARIHAAREELQREQELLASAQSEAEHVEVIKLRARAALEERDRHTAAEISRLQREIDLLTSVVNDFEALRKQAKDAWSDTTGTMIRRMGGGLEGVEAFMQLTGRSGLVNDSPRMDLDGVAVQRISMARGDRSRVKGDPADRTAIAHPGRALVGLLRTPWREKYALHGVSPGSAEVSIACDNTETLAAADELADAVAKASVTDTWLDAVHAWHPLPWIELTAPGPAGQALLDQLGAVPPGSRLGDRPIVLSSPGSGLDPAMPSERRATIAATNPERIEAMWAQRLRVTGAVTAASARLSTPWANQLVHPRPGDAVSLQHWYSMAAVGAWSRSFDTADAEEGTDLAFGLAAVGMLAATPFWLPHGQTYGYANSLPLDPEDLDQVRLPYPQVLVVLADPMTLPPVPGTDIDPVLARKLRELDNATLHMGRNEDPATLINLFGHIYDMSAMSPPPTLADVLAARGAQVEAVLLLGDALGRLDDVFAWCLAIPAASGGVLGRFTVAARRSATRFASQIDNLAAVAAWADWHPPDRELAIPAHASGRELAKLTSGAEFRKLEARGGAGSVRVLNVSRTNAATRDHESAGEGTPMAPHPRRGHWRRQRHGPKNSLVKRVRIAPVIVNAGRGGMVPRVYRLPTDPAATNTSSAP
jgi:hypothetical protein